MWNPKKAALEEADHRLKAAEMVFLWRVGATYCVSGGVLPMASYSQRTDDEPDTQPEPPQ